MVWLGAVGCAVLITLESCLGSSLPSLLHLIVIRLEDLLQPFSYFSSLDHPTHHHSTGLLQQISPFLHNRGLFKTPLLTIFYCQDKNPDCFLLIKISDLKDCKTEQILVPQTQHILPSFWVFAYAVHSFLFPLLQFDGCLLVFMCQFRHTAPQHPGHLW